MGGTYVTAERETQAVLSCKESGLHMSVTPLGGASEGHHGLPNSHSLPVPAF